MATKEEAHKGLVTDPSANPKTCAMCHKKIADTYATSLHFTTMGQKRGFING